MVPRPGLSGEREHGSATVMTTAIAYLLLTCIALLAGCVTVLMMWVTRLSRDVTILMERAAREITMSKRGHRQRL